MKHAYLIIAHNEFKILQSLVSALDDKRNDIFIHWDKKTKNLPYIKTNNSRVFLVKNRVDVRWGNYSQIESEYALFEMAYNVGKYEYYHILSGTHLPLFPQNYLHDFFEKIRGKQVLQFMYYDEFQTDLKMKRYNFFTKYFQIGSKKKRLFFQRLWNLAIVIQRKLNIHRNSGYTFVQCSNWVSITNDAVEYLIKNKKEIEKKYKYTLCGDEFFIPTELEGSNLKESIMYYDKMLKCTFINSNPIFYTNECFDDVINSGCLFARKFSEKDMEIVEKILNHIGIK